MPNGKINYKGGAKTALKTKVGTRTAVAVIAGLALFGLAFYGYAIGIRVQLNPQQPIYRVPTAPLLNLQLPLQPPSGNQVQISNINVQQQSPLRTKITFETNVITTKAEVLYGESSTLGQSLIMTTGTRFHSVNLSHNSPDKTLYYRIRAEAQGKTAGTSAIASFKTLHPCQNILKVTGTRGFEPPGGQGDLSQVSKATLQNFPIANFTVENTFPKPYFDQSGFATQAQSYRNQCRVTLKDFAINRISTVSKLPNAKNVRLYWQQTASQKVLLAPAAGKSPINESGERVIIPFNAPKLLEPGEKLQFQIVADLSEWLLTTGDRLEVLIWSKSGQGGITYTDYQGKGLRDTSTPYFASYSISP